MSRDAKRADPLGDLYNEIDACLNDRDTTIVQGWALHMFKSALKDLESIGWRPSVNMSEKEDLNMKPTETKNLTWKDAWWHLLNGERIKRPLWEGYWVWEKSPKDDKFSIMMHCRDGSIVDIRDTDFVAYTFSNIAQRDWMVVEE